MAMAIKPVFETHTQRRRLMREDKKHHRVYHIDRHVHGAGCGHKAVQHDGHTDYVVNWRLHHPHGKHCDDHGEA